MLEGILHDSGSYSRVKFVYGKVMEKNQVMEIENISEKVMECFESRLRNFDNSICIAKSRGKRCKLSYFCGNIDDSCVVLQLEDVELLVADHVQKVMKPNFAASWEEVGEENELEDTFALSTMKTLPGK